MRKRAYSIRTRIKTVCKENIVSWCLRVREHIPLEQGLRHSTEFIIDVVIETVREHIPLEQGLRLTQKFYLVKG